MRLGTSKWPCCAPLQRNPFKRMRCRAADERWRKSLPAELKSPIQLFPRSGCTSNLSTVMRIYLPPINSYHFTRAFRDGFLSLANILLTPLCYDKKCFSVKSYASQKMLGAWMTRTNEVTKPLKYWCTM